MNFRSSHLSLAVLLLGCASVSVRAQAVAAWSEWETIHPEGEEFSVSMPKNSSSDSEKFLYHKMELSGRLYLTTSTGGPVVAVASFSGIKSAPALYSDLERFNSYVDAFKQWFPGKVRGKDAVARMVQIGSKTFHGYAGREYKLTIGNLTGVAQAYATRKRFYVIVSLNTKPDADLQDKFLSSFYLPDRPLDEKKPAATAGNNTPQANDVMPAEPAVERKPQPSSNTNTTGQQNTRVGAGEDNTEAGVTASTNPATNTGTESSEAKPKRPPISGGVLNGKALYLPMPEVPAGEASGVVMVQVLVDEQGGVIEARAISGPVQLQAAAVNAARLARFPPTLLSGEPVRITGTLSYNFTKSN